MNAKLAISGLLAVSHVYAQQSAPPPSAPPGAPKAARTRVLEAGAKLLQNNGPGAPG